MGENEELEERVDDNLEAEQSEEENFAEHADAAGNGEVIAAANVNEINAVAEGPRESRIASADAELDELARFLETMQNYNSDVEDSIFMVYRKTNTEFKGKKGNAVRADKDPIVLFPGTTLDLGPATLTGMKKFLKNPFITGYGGVMQIIPTGLHAGVRLPISNVKVTQKALTGSAELQGAIGLGVSNKIQVKTITFDQGLIKIGDTKLEEKNDDGTVEEHDITNLEIDERGIRANDIEPQELTNTLNEVGRPVGTNTEADATANEAVEQQELENEVEGETTEHGAANALEDLGEDDEGQKGAIPIINKNTGEKLFNFTYIHITPHKRGGGLYNIDLECNGEKLRLKKVKKEGIKYIHEGGIKFKRKRGKVTTFEFLRGLEIQEDRVFVEERKWRVLEGKEIFIKHAREKGFKASDYSKDILDGYWEEQSKGEYFSTNSVLKNDQIGKPRTHYMNLSARAKHRGYCPFGPLPIGIEADADAIGTMGWGVGALLKRAGLDTSEQTWNEDEDRIRTGLNVAGTANAIGSVALGLYAGLARVVTAGAGIKFKIVGASKISLGSEMEFYKSIKPKSIKFQGMITLGLNALLQAFARVNLFVWEKELYVKTLMAKNLGTVSANIAVKYDFTKQKLVEDNRNASFTTFIQDTVRSLSEGQLSKQLLEDESVIKTNFAGNKKEFEGIIADLKIINDAIKAAHAGGENHMAATSIGPKELADRLNAMQFPVLSHIKRAQVLVRQCTEQLGGKAQSTTADVEEKVRVLEDCKAKLAFIKNWIDNTDHAGKNTDAGFEDTKTAAFSVWDTVYGKESKLLPKNMFSYSEQQNKLAGKVDKTRIKEDEEIRKIDKNKMKYIEKALKFKDKKHLGDADESHELLEEYQSIHDSQTLRKFIFHSARNRNRVLNAIDAVNKEQNGKQITKYSQRILSLQSQYDALSGEARNQANPVFYKAYCSNSFFEPKAIRQQLMGAANGDKFREFTEIRLQKGPFGSKKKKYIDAKKSFKDALAEKARIMSDGGDVSEVQARIDQYKNIVHKEVGKNTHMFSSVEDVTIMRRRYGKAQALIKADKESEDAVLKEDRKAAKIDNRLKQELMKKVDPINTLIKFEEKYKPIYFGIGKNLKVDLKEYHRKFVAAANSESKYNIAQNAINDYFDWIAFNPVRGNIRSAIEKGKTQYLYSDEALKGVQYEGKDDEYQGNAYDQMHKYGPSRHMFKKRSVMNHELVRDVVDKRLSKQRKQEALEGVNGITDADVLQYYNYRLSQKRLLDASFAKGSAIHHFFGNAKDFGKVTELSDMLEEKGYDKVLKALEQPQYEYVKGHYQDFLNKQVADIITPNHIMAFEMTRLNNAKNTYAEEKARIEADDTSEVMDAKLAEALMKKVKKDDAYTISYNEIIDVESEEAERMIAPHRKQLEESTTNLNVNYKQKGFFGKHFVDMSRQSRYIRFYNSTNDMVNATYEKYNKMRNQFNERNTNITNYKTSLNEQIGRSRMLLGSIETMKNNKEQAFQGDFFEREILGALTEQQREMFVVEEATNIAEQILADQVDDSEMDAQEANIDTNAEGIDDILANAAMV